MQITQNEIVAIVLILAILWIWFTWDKKLEGFTDFKVPEGKKWGDYVYYEDEDEFPVVAPSITRIEDTQYKLPEMPVQSLHAKINEVNGLTDTSNLSGMGAPLDDLDFDDKLINKMNQEDNRSQESVIHELPKSHDHPMREKTKQILTEKELMPGMEQKKIMEKSLEPKVVRKPMIIKPKSKKKSRTIKEDRYMALAILLSVLLIGFAQYSQ